MEVTHSKGLMYPALQLSSFRVRRDSLPPAFELPEEVARAVAEPLPEVTAVTLEEKALQTNLRMLEEDERDRRKASAVIAKEEAARKRELARAAEESKRESSKESVEKAKKVRDLMSLMGLSNPSAAERRLEESGWDYEKAVQCFLDGA